MIFAVLGLVFVGLSWTFVGVVMGSAPKKGLSAAVVQATGGIVPAVVGILVIYSGILAPVDWSAAYCWKAVAFYLSSAFLNFLMLQTMSAAMQRGPNSVIWAMTQSGMLLTFLYGVVVEGDAMNMIRGAGIVLLLGAMVCFGVSKNNTAADGKPWLFLGILSFLLCGSTQIAASIPSYDPRIQEGFNYVARSIVVGAGMAVSGFAWIVCKDRAACFHEMAAHFRDRRFWLYILLLQGFGLISAYFLIYRCMDALAAEGIGSASYPVMVSSCLIGFILYSRFILRERMNLLQKTGLACCIAGVILICVK